MRIYTKTGDRGETDLIGKRVSKNDTLIHAVGEIDEAQARIALIKHYLKDDLSLSYLSKMDHNLFLISSILVDIENKLNLKIDESEIASLEKNIDQMEMVLPKLTSFITYDGTIEAIHVSLLRSQIRKIERLVTGIKVNDTVLAYLNRLSDFLFVWMRYLNYQVNFTETRRKL